MLHETKCAKSGDIHIAYQVVGSGPIDLVFIPGWLTHVELQWEEPRESPSISRPGSRARHSRARCSSPAPSESSYAGSRIQFADRGAHALKGIPGEWRVFSVEEASD